ncbi:unnamed protein product, partial [Polarella glacialis]
VVVVVIWTQGLSEVAVVVVVVVIAVLAVVVVVVVVVIWTQSERRGGRAAMAISLVPYIGLACFTAQYLFPAYESLRVVLKTEEKPSSSALTQWTVYWVICVSFMTLESNLLFLLMDYLPLYLELKALAFLWLVHPEYQGAAWLWHSKLKALHQKYDADFYDQFMQVLGPFGKAGEEEALPAKTVEGTANKEE